MNTSLSLFDVYKELASRERGAVEFLLLDTPSIDEKDNYKKL